jgi:phosphoglycerate dehydrogenase-like enzyme
MGMGVEGVRRADGRRGLLALLPRADAVTIHCPLTPETRGLFDDDAFAAMKPGALLVNVARGDIVDRGALDRALASKKLGGVGLDVFWQEPWNPDDPLLSRDDVVALPHVAGSTEEAFGRIAEVCAHNVEAIVRGGELMHRIA